ncbi:MAG: hypothetical protein O7D30_10765 [Rickettsia endosymbiont of Ixodes persulcatus]|nr:hypothetical protein [Rickettsia endosymbiont of Ixodes persulcatus]
MISSCFGVLHLKIDIAANSLCRKGSAIQFQEKNTMLNKNVLLFAETPKHDVTKKRQKTLPKKKNRRTAELAFS